MNEGFSLWLVCYIVFVESLLLVTTDQLRDAIIAGLPSSSLAALPEVTIFGKPDERIRVYGDSGVQDSVCTQAETRLQYGRYGFNSICLCERIDYNKDGAPGVNSTEFQLPFGSVTGGWRFVGGQFVDTTLNYIEAGVCIPGPCCQQLYYSQPNPASATLFPRTVTARLTTRSTTIVSTTPVPTTTSTPTTTTTIPTTPSTTTTTTTPTTTTSTTTPTTTSTIPTTTSTTTTTTTPPTTMSTTTSTSTTTPSNTPTTTTTTTPPTTSTTTPLRSTSAKPCPVAIDWPMAGNPPPPVNFQCQIYPRMYKTLANACEMEKGWDPNHEWGDYFGVCCTTWLQWNCFYFDDGVQHERHRK